MLRKIIPLVNNLSKLYILNEEGVPCFVHSKEYPNVATQPIVPRFNGYTCVEDYMKDDIKYIVPMTAKEIESKEEQLEKLQSKDFYVEEKFDGTRGIMHFYTCDPKTLREKYYPNYKEDEKQYLSVCLLQGSSIVDGKRRIYDYFLTHSKSKDRVDFLKQEYGIGGYTGYPISCSFNSKGFTIDMPSDKEINGRYSKSITYTWKTIAEEIQHLIDIKHYYAQKGYTRVFSRRESKKTGWLTENTDSVPQLRDLNRPELAGTIIDGEMFIPNQPFKAVASTLNCKWDKAITRQLELGGVVFHAFDILFFKGIDLRKMPLERRKVYLHIVCDTLNSPFVKEVKYYDEDGIVVPLLNMSDRDRILNNPELYPNLAEDIKHYMSNALYYEEDESNDGEPLPFRISKASYYEYIVFTGGEGVVVKPKTGKYYHKRGREYEKIKKFLTRECIICGFTPPTQAYKGKFPDDSWSYWIDNETGEKQDPEECANMSAKKLQKTCTPVTKYYFENWVGNVEYGVLISEDEIKKLPKNKKHDIRTVEVLTDYNDRKYLKVLVVGECSGFDDDERAWFTGHKDEVIGQVIEVKANEIFRDTGKLRHPRYLRLRPDKSAEQCTFKEHIL